MLLWIINLSYGGQDGDPWTPVVDAQTPNWTAVVDAQSGSWTPVVDGQ